MAQASHVVTAVSAMSSAEVEADTSSGSSEDNSSNIFRSESFLAMPPPLPKKPMSMRTKIKQKPKGLDLLSMMASELPIVSPDITALSTPKYHVVPNIKLDDDEEEKDGNPNAFGAATSDEDVVNEEEDGVSDLSPDQCAEVVDGIFGDLDDDILMGPPMKKQKVDS